MTKENDLARGEKLPSVEHGDLPRPTTNLFERVDQTVREMRSAVQLSRQFGVPVADHKLILDWADQLEGNDRNTS